MTLRYINLLLYDIDQYTSNNIASYTFYANIMLSKFECWLIRIYLPVTLNRNSRVNRTVLDLGQSGASI